MVSKSILELLKHFNLHFTLYYPRYIIFHRDTKHLVQTLTAPKAKLEQTLNVTLAIPKQTALSGCRPAGEQCSEFHPGIPSVQDVQPPQPWTPRDTELPWQAEEADTCTDTSLWQARPARLSSQMPSCCPMSPGTSWRRPCPCTLPSVLSSLWYWALLYALVRDDLFVPWYV